VLVLQVLVHAAFFHFSDFTGLLLFHLLVELLSDKASSLLLTKHSLLLLLIVQQSVELLNGCPLVLFSDL